ncbi:undecaprenyldiphospho-muramoylpentapeptide beta-N-acetylglucosaminyltransferase [Bacteroidetes oral taxon 274 str. F0058]|nr:undecaprenyldiphospho-muramoylpentapeptide beta-N-acetylglucosaminyltransferase [Bacteroidetes oral taxon 274 str. F0058]
MRFLISGGGTGGHIFPAVSIANALRQRQPDCEILFVGANGRMEMERVPEAGYNIVGLDIQGLERRKVLRNIRIIYNFLRSRRKARQIVRSFRPDVAIGVGGYVSAAAMSAAAALGVPVVLQEQNSFAGVTNRFLAKKASKICVAYDGMERFFDKGKIVKTGNPVRQNIIAPDIDRQAAYDYFRLERDKKTILVVGGSLGAKTINDSIARHIDKLLQTDCQIVWQTGKNYFAAIKAKISEQGIKFTTDSANPVYAKRMFVSDFISQMDYAYNVADLVISRAGASSVSELCLLGKPAILVPSPNVAENHQYHNAMALVAKNAALLVEDAEAVDNLLPQALQIVADDSRLRELSANIRQLALPNSAQAIAEVILAQIENKK